MKIFIQALRKGGKLAPAVLLLLTLLSLSFVFAGKARAQKRPETLPARQGTARQIAGKRGKALRSAVVNIKDLARREARAPSRRIERREEEEETEEVEPPEDVPQDMPVPAGAAAFVEKSQPKSLIENQKALGPSPAPAASFLASDDTGRIPPDTHGAVGLNHLMVVHNGRVRIQNRAGNVISNVSLVNFWSALPNAPADIFDPKVLYDPYSNRWMMTACAERRSADSSVMIAVSRTSDPTGVWNLYRVDADSADVLWADFPSIGFNKDWIVVQMNMFPITDGTGTFTSHLYVFNKADLYAGGQGLYTLIKAPKLGGTMVPAITYDATLPAVYVLQTWNSNSGGNGYLGLYSITGVVGSEVLNVANTTFPILIGTPNPWTVAAPEVGGTTDFAPQLSSALKVQNNDARMHSVVYRNGSIWGVHTVFLPAGGSPTRSAVQWWELSPTGTIRQRGRIEDSTGNNFYAFPSISVNRDNDVLIGYSRYSPAQFVSANYSFRAATDPLNTLRDDTVLKAGDATYYKTGSATPPQNRWGDYSATVVDPVNDKDMWTIQEYAASPGSTSDRWGTWWGKVSLASAPTQPSIEILTGSYNEGAGRASITVTRTGSTAAEETFTYATSDAAGLTPCNTVSGVASSRCDYATSIGTLRFAIGETSKTISIPLVDDAFAEGVESFTLTLNIPIGFGIEIPISAPVIIADNDAVNGSNPLNQNAFFVRQHYIDFLGREPDPVGLQGWLNILNNCGTTVAQPCDRIEVSSGFFRSEEFQSRGYFIYRFYSAVGKIPTYNLFMPDFAKVSGFLSAQQLEANKVAFVNEFMTRGDYLTKYGSITNSTSYVDALLSTLGLPAHPGRQGWINALNSGTPRATVFRQVVESVEVYNKYYNEAFVIMQYFGYLRRDADISYLQWIQTMNQTNGDYRTMINGFLNSAEYRQRFGP
ncbi:MAG TPA: DUF4214 domain-containing protein [Pyrinomonadaceae bacterium]|nr:DUF4214 domain-containing protein [Pyrinomonadaceae bacterium]